MTRHDLESMAAAYPQSPAWQTALKLSNDVGNHLEEPVDLYMLTLSALDFNPAPAFVRVKVTSEWLNQTLYRSAACLAAGMKTVSRARAEPDHVEDSPALHDFTRWHLEVDSVSFRMVAANSNIVQFATNWVENTDLVKSIVALRNGDLDSIDAMGAHGGALFHCGEHDPFDFIDDVVEKMPAVGAKQTALDMAKAIQEAASDPAPAAIAPKPKRRRGI